jgi:hypothetical protein
MKVYIGPYKNWIGPYQIAEKLLFWLDKDHDTVWKLGEWLNNTWVKTFCEWAYSKQKRNVKVKLHDYDIWSMDSTLALIVIPMLKQLKETKHGAPFVDDEDVPEHLRRNLPYDNSNDDTDDLWFQRWDWVMDEMIFAFESKVNDWEDQFWTVKPKLDLLKYPEDEGKEVIPVRWLEVGDCDWEGRKKYEERIQNGFRLFGKYFQGLWD